MTMKIKLFFLAGLLALSVGCAKPRLALIPEISPPLIQEDVFTWTGQVAGNALFPCAEGIGWVDASGQIVTWNPDKKAAGSVFRLPFAVSDPPFRQGDFLVLKSKADDRLLVYDLKLMKTSFELRDKKIKKILAVTGNCLVFLDGENLTVYSWQNPAGIFSWPTAENEFFNCHFFPERILIMSSRQLFVFWKSNRKFQVLPLPLAAAGDFLCQGDCIFYGSSQRQLVKYSLRKNKLVWKLKLSQNLERQPFVFANNIVISPADNNVMQLNRQGSVQWWLALNSILRFNLLPMADHMAAFLVNRDIKFVDFRRRQATVFKSTGRPAGMPMVYNHDLYFLLTAGKTQKLQRVGNRYGIDVTLAPKKTQMLGAPITFSVQTINLLKPLLHCVIRDEAGQEVLSKKFAMASRASLVWLPTRAGVYRLRVSAAARNCDAEKEISFQVFDPQKIVPEFYFHF